MLSPNFRIDPRYFQVIFQSVFLSYGVFFLDWKADYLHYFISITGCLFFNYLFESLKQRRLLSVSGKTGFSIWGFSVLISAMSLCLLLKTNHWYISLFASFLTVASKYIFRFDKKHIFNPSAFGIVATLLFTEQAWLSPGQWGTHAVMFFAAITLGTIVVTSVQKLDVSLAFLVTYISLLFWRQVYILGWPIDHFFHSVSTGSLLLFTFFMISDPRTSPDHRGARIGWGIIIAVISFYFAAFKWKYNTSIWVLVAMAPLLPLINHLFKATTFNWKQTVSHYSIPSLFKYINMKSHFKKLTASLLLFVMVSQEALAFCGFYVSKADGTLKNKTSQVIMVRDGDRNVITMYNDFKGNFKDFAMVVPVPVVLKQNDIRVVNQNIFHTLNEYSKPRLVEYYDENPCNRQVYERMEMQLSGAVAGVSRQKSAPMLREEKVKIEAKYIVGEYDILILSAKESSALKDWLDDNGYKIPAGANEVLEPYIKSNLKFFVVKVNEKELKKIGGNFLRPLQISFNSPKFMLPIRLGMANADGDQDMIVYAFTKSGRVECTNYRTVSIPTSKNIPLFVKDNFGTFYSNLFQHQWKGEGKAVTMLEYAWDVSPQNFMKCDPCVATAPSPQDLVQSGVWWLNSNEDGYQGSRYSNRVYFTRLHVRYNRKSFPQDLQFQVTPNNENFQARYIVTHPAKGDFDCPEGKAYLKELKARRENEMEMLQYLTGKSFSDWDVAIDTEEVAVPAEASYAAVAIEDQADTKKHSGIATALMGVVGLIGLVGAGLMRI